MMATADDTGNSRKRWAAEQQRPRHTIRNLVAVLLLLAGSIVYAAIQATRPGVKDEAGDAQTLFATAKGLHGERLEARIEAATKLAGMSGASQRWVAILLLDARLSLAPTGDEDADAIAKDLLRYELAITTALLRNLPATVDRDVLFAVTYLLNEEGRGKWGITERVLFGVKHTTCLGPPIRELARKCFAERLGVDLGWDVVAWQKAVLSGTSSSRPSTAPTTSAAGSR